MPRPATGSTRWSVERARWETRVTYADGRRSKPIAMPGLPACAVNAPSVRECGACDPCRLARAKGTEVSKVVRNGGGVPEGTGETVNEWFERWIKARVAKGLRSTAHDRTRFTKWVAPVFGTKPIAGVVRRDLEELVQRLDRAVATKECLTSITDSR